MKARALLIEALVGIASAAVAAGAFCWMVKVYRTERGGHDRYSGVFVALGSL